MGDSLAWGGGPWWVTVTPWGAPGELVVGRAADGAAWEGEVVVPEGGAEGTWALEVRHRGEVRLAEEIRVRPGDIHHLRAW